MRKLSHEEIPRADPRDIISLPRHPVSAILHDIRSVHNVGSMFRTSDAAAVERIFLTGFTATPDHHAIHRTALGAQDAVPWENEEDPITVVRKLRASGVSVAALEITDEPTKVSDLQPGHFPLCLVVGNEVDGVPQSLLDACDLALEIPQYGIKQSLNVSVAFGIAVFGIIERYREIAP